MNESQPQRTVRWEIAALLLLFFVHGGWPVPDVNEACYVGKAIHFWHPDWIVGDLFLDSKNAHWFFYATFGLFSFVLPPTAMAWAGRSLAWFLLAIAWRRLSYTLVPFRYFSILTAAGMLYYLDAFTMSGEWVVGGIEGKSFAFPLMFLGLEAMLRGRWHHVWLYLGAASAFHVLVGGWAVIIALFVLATEKIFSLKRTPFSILIFHFSFLIAGGLLALPGLIPALQMDWKTPPEIIAESHRIQVFERLPHHLHPDGFPWTFKFRFGVLTLLWVALSMAALRQLRGTELRVPFLRMSGFVFGSLILAAIGFVGVWCLRSDPLKTAELLRFYWFRMCDFAVPMGVSFVASILFVCYFEKARLWLAEVLKNGDNVTAVLGGFFKMFLATLLFGVTIFLVFDWLIYGLLFSSSFRGAGGADGATSIIPVEPCIPWGLALLFGIGWLAMFEYVRKNSAGQLDSMQSIPLCAWLLLLCAMVVWAPSHFYLSMAEQRSRPLYSRCDPVTIRHAYLWNDVCNWISDPKNKIPENALFLTPSESKNFKWKTRRPEVATWKDMPQDAKTIKRWYDAIEQLYTYRPKNGPARRDYSLQLLYSRYNPERLEKLQEKYKYDYILCGKYPALNLPIVYENQGYVVYEGRPNK